MNNYLQPGNTVTLTAPAGGVTSGNGYQIGQIFVVAANDADATDPFEGMTEGVFTLPKETGTTWSEGDLLYWDDGDDEVSKTAVGNLLIGTAMAAALSGDATGRVRLNGASSRDDGEIGTGAVGTTELADDAVTADKLADSADTDGSRAVTTNHIRDAAVTEAKLAAPLLSAAADTTIYDHADDVGANAAIAAATIDRVVTVSAKVTETLAGVSTSPSFKVGYAGSVATFLDITAGDADDIFFGSGTLPSGEALNVTVANGTGGSEAGKVAITIMATPTASA